MSQYYLWHISANTRGYDVYSDAVVCAETEEEACGIHPNGRDKKSWDNEYGSWVSDPSKVTAKKIGIAEPGIEIGSVICASFHAG